MIEKLTSYSYIKDKFDIKTNKMVIGKGSFGALKFALTLVSPENYKTNIGDLICIKKSKHIGFIKKNNEILELNEIYESVIGDYFADSFADFIYSPNVYDMQITNLVSINKH